MNESDTAKRQRYWKVYWRVMSLLAPSASGAKERFFERVVMEPPKGRWVDAGCGRRSFPRWRPDDPVLMASAGGLQYGFDADLSALRNREDDAKVCAAVLEKLPYRDESFGCVISNMVFEHVERPDESIRELVRITARGGRILIHTVNSKHYLALVARLTPFRFHRWVVQKLEGRGYEDVYPTQYQVNTFRALTTTFERHGARRTWGGEIADLPVFAPYPIVFWAALFWGIVEFHIGRLPWIGGFLRPNLLVEFTRLE